MSTYIPALTLLRHFVDFSAVAEQYVDADVLNREEPSDCGHVSTQPSYTFLLILFVRDATLFSYIAHSRNQEVEQASGDWTGPDRS